MVSISAEILLGLHPWSLVSNGVAPFNGVLVGTVIPIVYPGTEHVTLYICSPNILYIRSSKRFVLKNFGHWQCLTHRLSSTQAQSTSLCTFGPPNVLSRKFCATVTTFNHARSMSLCTFSPQTFCPEKCRSLAQSYLSSTQARSMSPNVLSRKMSAIGTVSVQC